VVVLTELLEDKIENQTVFTTSASSTTEGRILQRYLNF